MSSDAAPVRVPDGANAVAITRRFLVSASSWRATYPAVSEPAAPFTALGFISPFARRMTPHVAPLATRRSRRSTSAHAPARAMNALRRRSLLCCRSPVALAQRVAVLAAVARLSSRESTPATPRIASHRSRLVPRSSGHWLTTSLRSPSSVCVVNSRTSSPPLVCVVASFALDPALDPIPRRCIVRASMGATSTMLSAAHAASSCVSFTARAMSAKRLIRRRASVGLVGCRAAVVVPVASEEADVDARSPTRRARRRLYARFIAAHSSPKLKPRAGWIASVAGAGGRAAWYSSLRLASSRLARSSGSSNPAGAAFLGVAGTSSSKSSSYSSSLDPSSFSSLSKSSSYCRGGEGVLGSAGSSGGRGTRAGSKNGRTKSSAADDATTRRRDDATGRDGTSRRRTSSSAIPPGATARLARLARSREDARGTETPPRPVASSCDDRGSERERAGRSGRPNALDFVHRDRDL
eukprot:29916-Pelagococcus_subviridis.AAC.16